MARKFNIGDTVEVVKRVDNLFRKGYRGIIDEIMPDVEWPYYMKRRNGLRCPFKPQELKLIRKGTKNGTN